MQVRAITVLSVFSGLLLGPAVGRVWAQSLALDYFSVTPCRLLDTRVPAQGPALASGAARFVTVAGSCGVPANAGAIAANITAVAPTGGGNLRLYPGDGVAPATSSLNFGGGQTRANNAVIKLNASGALAVFIGQAAGTTTHLIIDVNGYFE